MKPRDSKWNARAQTKAPPALGKFTPSWAPLTPVLQATSAPGIIASSSALPAFSAVAPSAPKMPVPMIMAAVSSVAATRPMVRADSPCDVLDIVANQSELVAGTPELFGPYGACRGTADVQVPYI